MKILEGEEDIIKVYRKYVTRGTYVDEVYEGEEIEMIHIETERETLSLTTLEAQGLKNVLEKLCNESDYFKGVRAKCT